MLDCIRALQAEVAALILTLKKLQTVQVSQKTPIDMTRAIVDEYFRAVRASLVGIEQNSVMELDAQMHSLLEATHKRTSRLIFIRDAEHVKRRLIDVEKLALIETGGAVNRSINKVDIAIVETLKKVCPSAALSYEQATLDMEGAQRLSWRGPATDYREALRECLDVLAPDDEVQSVTGFRLEQGVTKPTMKQKATHILRMRNQAKNAIKPVQDSIAIVEDSVGSFVRSVYSRANISTHTPTDKSEVIRVRDQVRTVLCELLEIS